MVDASAHLNGQVLSVKLMLTNVLQTMDLGPAKIMLGVKTQMEVTSAIAILDMLVSCVMPLPPRVLATAVLTTVPSTSTNMVLSPVSTEGSASICPSIKPLDAHVPVGGTDGSVK